MNRNKLWYWLGAILVLAIAIVSVLLFRNDRGKRETLMLGQSVTIRGEVVCLPHKNTSGPQTLECALGLKDKRGDYYALRDPQQRFVMTLNTGSVVAATGTLVEYSGMPDKYDVVGILEVTAMNKD